MLWGGAEAGEGGARAQLHPAGLAHLAQGASGRVGGCADSAGTASHLAIQRDCVADLSQLVQLPGVCSHHQAPHDQQGMHKALNV